MTLLLKSMLTNPNKDGYREKYNIIKNSRHKNGDAIYFLIGVIFPSVIILQNNILATIFIFITIEVLLFYLMINTSMIFPNIALIISGVDVYEVFTAEHSIRYVMVFSSNNLDNIDIVRIGNENNCNTYVTVGCENECK